MRRFSKRRPTENGEFLWLMSLSDLMILLFILFVVLYSFTYKKLKAQDYQKILATLKNAPIPKDPIDEAKQQLNEWVKAQQLNDQIEISKKDDAVLIEIKDKVLFGSGEFQISPIGVQRIQSLAQTLEKLPPKLKLGIEGHTDDIPISTKEIKDNWDLSAKRAMSVMRALNLSTELLKRTSIIAQGEMNPLVPNRTPTGDPIPENQNKNRRVTLRVF